MLDSINKEPYTMELTKKIQVPLSEEIFNKLQELANRDDRPLASVARSIIVEYFNPEKD